MAGHGREAPARIYVDELARREGVSRSTVFRLIRKFKVQRIKIPGDKRTYISSADAERMFKPEPVEARRRR